MSQTPQNKKPPMPCSSPFDIDPIQRIYTQAQSTLFMKYNTLYYNNDYIQTYYLIFNEKCRAVARFNDYLILDDNTEFLKRFYTFEEVLPKLKTIFEFYETYSRIFPNYMILQESECLYRNIRKKQKMIDAFNQIKKEEEENRERLKIGKKSGNSVSGGNSNRNVVFDKNVQNSINKCEPSVVNSKWVNKNNNNNGDCEDSVNSISISLLSRKCMYNNGVNNGNVFKTPGSSFVNEDNSFASIAVIIQGMDNINNNKNVVMPMETPKKKKKVSDKELLCENNNSNNNVIDDSLASLNEFNNNNDHNSHHHIQSALNNNRKFISHKSTASVPEINNSIKIINNYHKIIIPQGTTNAVININAHIYPNDNDNNNTKPTTSTTVNNNNNTNNTQSPSTTTKGSSTASKQSNTLTHNSNSNNIYTHSNLQSNHMKSSSKIDTHKNITIKNFQTNMLTHSNNTNNTNTNSKSLSKCKNYSMQKNNTNSYLNTQSSVHNNKGNITTEGNIVNGSCTINNRSLSKNKHHTHYSNNHKIDFAITKSAFKSPEKILSLSKKKNITTTVSTTNHIKPIYKNKNLSNIQTLSALQNTKVNPFKTKFERKKSIQKHNTSNSLNANVNNNNKHKHQVTQVNNTSHHEVLNSFINQNSIFKKEIRTSLINADTIDNNNNNTKDTITNNDKQYKSKHEHLSMRKYNGGVNVGIGSLRMFGVGFKHNHISTSSSNKLQQHSIEVNNYNCKGSNNNNNNNACSQRKPANMKTPVVKKVVMSPKNNNYVDKGNRAALTEKVKLTQKCPLNREMIKQNNNNICVNGNSNNNNNPSKIIRSFGSKGVDANTTKMKFLRK